MLRTCALLLALASAAFVTTVAAQSTPVSVAIHVDACVGVDATRTEQIARLELGPAPDSEAAAVTRVRVECHEDLVLLRVNDTVTGKTIERRLDVRNEAPEARARVLGVAISESVHASWIEFAIGESPPSEYVEATATTAQREAAASAVSPEEAPRAWSHFHIEGGLALRLGIGGAPLLSGFTAGAAYAFGPHWALSSRFQMLGGSASLEGSDFLFVGYALHVGARYSLQLGPCDLALDAALRYTDYSAQLRPAASFNDASVGAGTWGISFRQRLSLPVTSWFALHVAVEEGIDFSPIEFQLGRSAVSFGRVHLAQEFGVRLSF